MDWRYFSIIKNYNEESDEGYFLEVKKVEKIQAHLHNKNEHVIHITSLKQALNHRLILKKIHRIIKFNQNAWLKSNIFVKTDLRKKAKTDSEKYFFRLMNNEVFCKNYEKYDKTKRY